LPKNATLTLRRSRVVLYAGLLKCNCWGVADGILESDHRTGDASGAGASGQAAAAHGKLSQSKPDGLLGRPVDFRLGL